MHVGGRRAGLVARAVFAPLLVAALTIGGCTSEAAAPPIRADAVTTSSTSTPTTETPPTTEPARSFEPLIADPNLPLADQVEAAYLFHWEVLLHAYRTGDTSQLPLVYAGEALEARIGEIEQNRSDGVLVGGYVEHNYEVTVLAEDSAVVIDGYRSYLVPLDSDSGDELGTPSGRQLLQEFQLESIDGRWLVVLTLRHEVPQ